LTRPLVQYFRTQNLFSRAWLWHTSAARNIFTTPLRILKNANRLQEEIVQGSEVGLKHFVPVNLVPENCGSTRGLCEVLRRMHQKHWTPGHYFLLKLDRNLYWRVAKVTNLLFFFIFLLNFISHICFLDLNLNVQFVMLGKIGITFKFVV